MLTERSIINFLVWIGGLILGPYLAASAVQGNFYPIGVLAAACSLVFIFGVLRDRMCLLPLMGTFITGKLNFIPVLHPEPFELFPLALIAYYLIAYLTLQRKKMQIGPLYFFVPILIIGAIILYHEHQFGLHSIGGSREGSRPAIFMLVAVLAYICGVSTGSPSPRFMVWTPFICVVLTFIFAIPYTVTTYLPSTAPYFFVFIDSINGSAYLSNVLDTDEIVRNQAQANVASTLMIFLVAYYPFYTWWRPQRWWMAVAALGCIALVIMGGFRSVLAVFGLALLLATWCHLGWRTLAAIPAIFLGIFLLISAQDSHYIHLPDAAQRTLSFLPGNWDPEVMSTAKSSNHFRAKIIETYMREEAHKSPWFGNGVSFDIADFDLYTYLALTQETDEGYYQSKEFIVSKQFHTGWVSLYDSVGLVGFVTFLFFSGSMIWVTGRMIFRKGVDHRSPLFPMKIWMFTNISASFVGYFTVFGDFRTTFPVYCYYAIVLVHLNRLEKEGYRASAASRAVPFDPTRTEAPIPA